MGLTEALVRESMVLCVIDPTWCRKSTMFHGMFRDIITCMERMEDDTLT